MSGFSITKHARFQTLFVCGLGFLIGCADTGETVHHDVSGLVRLEGTPLTSGTVQFIPLGNRGELSPRLTGVIGHDGQFSLIGPGGKPGAPEGVYVVTIHPAQSSVNGSAINGTTFARSEHRVEMVLPEIYSSEETSGITAQVDADSYEFEFDLSAKPTSREVTLRQ